MVRTDGLTNLTLNSIAKTAGVTPQSSLLSPNP
jgi:hypothetical protein